LGAKQSVSVDLPGVLVESAGCEAAVVNIDAGDETVCKIGLASSEVIKRQPCDLPGLNLELPGAKKFLQSLRYVSLEKP